MTSPRDAVLVGLFGSVAIMSVTFAVVGAFRFYSPIPYWDVWDGTVDFYLNIKRGNYSAWWAQHNEHRIVFSRIIFWICYEFFSGASWFLFAINYMLAGTSAFLFLRILREKSKTAKPDTSEILFGLAVVAWLYLWCQQENFAWEFQSQFFLAQLFPLCAFYWLYRSVDGAGGNRAFFVACCFGLASIGTMANGLLALPLMAAYAAFVRQGVVKVGILLILFLGAFFLYMLDYVSPAHHGPPFEAVWGNPFGFVHYLLLYVGSPFFYLFGGSTFGKGIAFVAGLTLILVSSLNALSSFDRPRENALNVALLFFILYIGGTAVGAAGGRLVFGVDQALSGRYTTPALMAWVALAIANSHPILATLKSTQWKALLPIALCSTPIILLQYGALVSNTGYLFDRSVAALALTLQINDRNQISKIYYNPERLAFVSKEISALGLSFYGQYPFLNISQNWDSTVRLENLRSCRSSLETAEAIEGDRGFLRISGWIFDDSTKTVPEVVRFVNGHGKIVGVALSGQERGSLTEIAGDSSTRSGFIGYLRIEYLGDVLMAIGDTSCQIQVEVPELLYSIAKTELSAEINAVKVTAILENNQWLGSDFQKTRKDGIQVYGSYVTSDADVGSVSIRIRRGESIFYRSGPVVTRQFMEVVADRNLSRRLPESTEWVLLSFIGEKLPEGEFVVKFSDNGSGWGEWSAVAVKR